MEINSEAVPPKVSAIVAVYNGEKNLRRCVANLIGQTLKEIEIILVDDGSKDSSGAICDEYAAKDSRVRVIHQENGGQGTDQNAGIQAARGEYICFCDSDDWYELNALEIMYRRAAETNADLLVASYRRRQNGIVHEPSSALRAFATDDLKEALSNIWKADRFSGSWGKLYKKSLLIDEKIAFPPRGPGENVAFACALFPRLHRVAGIHEPVYCYDIRGDGTSVTQQFYADISSVLRKVAFQDVKVFEEIFQVPAREIGLLCDICLMKFTAIVASLYDRRRGLSAGERIEQLKAMANDELSSLADNAKHTAGMYSKIILNIFRRRAFVLGDALLFSLFRADTAFHPVTALLRAIRRRHYYKEFKSLFD